MQVREMGSIKSPIISLPITGMDNMATLTLKTNGDEKCFMLNLSYESCYYTSLDDAYNHNNILKIVTMYVHKVNVKREHRTMLLHAHVPSSRHVSFAKLVLV